MKKLLIIILIWMGVFVLLRPVGEFKAEAVGNIVYRRNLVTGIITADNGDKSYAVEIGESGKSIKKIFTLSPDPDLAVGDKARVLYRGGNKEDMILLAPTKLEPVVPSIIRRYALIIASPNELKVFDMQSVVLYLLTTGGWAYSGCDITMDADGNTYTETNWETLKKYDSSGNLLVTQEIESGDNSFVSINVGPDGYLYTLELIDEGYDVKKRSPADLTIQEVIPITDEIYYSYDGPICLDSDGNIYVFNDPYIEKFSNAGALLARIETDGLSNEYAGCGVCGANVYFVKRTNKIYYAPLSLASYSEWNLPSSEAYALTVADGKLILSGWDGDGDGATTQYDSDRNLVLQVKLAAGYAYKAGGYNF